MRKLILFLGLVCSITAPGAQLDNLISPEILPDHRVTVRLRAPKATDVSFFADWMRIGTHEAMTRDAQGVWSATVGPIPPGIYIYTFDVDGMTIADPVNPKMKLRARTSASLLELPGTTPLFWEARDVPHGTVEIVSQKSSALKGETRQFLVYKPPGYDAARSTKYPVLYLLHGNNDTAAGWTQVGHAHFILDNLLAEKKARPMLVVMPFGHAAPYGSRDTAGGGNTAQFERYLLEDVMPTVEKNYRTARGRENRAIIGYSMGGGHSLQIGLSHLDVFATVGGMSSAVPGDFETRFKDLLDHPAKTNERLKLFWFACGRDDSLFSRSEKLSSLLTAHQVKHVFYPSDGAHTYTVWRNYLAEVAPLLFQGSR